MKTLTSTQARQNLGSWLQRAISGEDIGIVWDGKVVALRPVEVHSSDYALMEYGVTEAELNRAEKKIVADLKKEKVREWDGTVSGLKR